MTVSQVQGRGRQKGVPVVYRSHKETGSLINKVIKLEIAINDQYVQPTIRHAIASPAPDPARSATARFSYWTSSRSSASAPVSSETTPSADARFRRNAPAYLLPGQFLFRSLRFLNDQTIKLDGILIVAAAINPQHDWMDDQPLILVVDDDPGMCRFLLSALSAQEYRAIAAVDGGKKSR